MTPVHQRIAGLEGLLLTKIPGSRQTAITNGFVQQQKKCQSWCHPDVGEMEHLQHCQGAGILIIQPSSTTQHSTAQRGTARHSTAQHNTIQPAHHSTCTARHGTEQHGKSTAGPQRTLAPHSAQRCDTCTEWCSAVHRTNLHSAYYAPRQASYGQPMPRDLAPVLGREKPEALTTPDTKYSGPVPWASHCSAVS